MYSDNLKKYLFLNVYNGILESSRHETYVAYLDLENIHNMVLVNV